MPPPIPAIRGGMDAPSDGGPDIWDAVSEVVVEPSGGQLELARTPSGRRLVSVPLSRCRATGCICRSAGSPSQRSPGCPIRTTGRCRATPNAPRRRRRRPSSKCQGWRSCAPTPLGSRARAPTGQASMAAVSSMHRRLLSHQAKFGCDAQLTQSSGRSRHALALLNYTATAAGCHRGPASSGRAAPLAVIARRALVAGGRLCAARCLRGATWQSVLCTCISTGGRDSPFSESSMAALPRRRPCTHESASRKTVLISVMKR